MGKIFNENNEIIWICSIFGVLLLIGFTVIMRNVVIPEYKNEYEDKTKYLYEITIDEKKYIVDRLHTKVKVSKSGYWGSAGYISFTTDDGIFIHSSQYEIKKVLREDFEDKRGK